jgi:hypothetical protein
MHYKLDYALRICTHNGRTQSCVHIYSQMGLYEEAVDLALEVYKVNKSLVGVVVSDIITTYFSIETWNWLA